MKKIYLVALALSLLVLPRPLLGQERNGSGSPTDSLASSGLETMVAGDAGCETGTLTAFAADPEKKGVCRCPPKAGAVVSGCSDGQDELDCEQKTCHYKLFDVRREEVVAEGDVDCEWHPYGRP